MSRDKYEISLWEDSLVAASGNVSAHFEETKIAVIGSDTMTSNCRAYNPTLVENVNGTHTFTFKMYMKYTEKGKEEEKIDNPFLNLLVNERKVKVYWKDKWYDFVIKKIQENSSDKSITYTCTDLYINELSKNGFNLIFDNELENNQGTAVELAQMVLEDTDWQVNTAGSDVIQQEKEEPVYEVTVTNAISSVTDQTTSQTISVPKNSKILVFYSYVQEILQDTATSGSKKIQFAYTTNYETDTNSQLVINADCCSRNLYWWKTVDDNNVDCIVLRTSSSSTGAVRARVYYNAGVSSNYRASRLVQKQTSIFDPITEKYVRIYEAASSGTGYAQGDTIYGYDSTRFDSPTIVNNIIVNSSNFTSTDGWLQNGGNLHVSIYPPYTGTSQVSTYTAAGYLHVTNLNGNPIYNAGLREASIYTPHGYQYGEKYVLRYKARQGSASAPNETYYSSNPFTPRICNYENEDGYKSIPNNASDYFNFGTASYDSTSHWFTYTATCTKSVTRSEIYSDRVGFFLVPTGAQDKVNAFIEDIEFFPYVLDASNPPQIIVPGAMDAQSVTHIYHYYYNHSAYEASSVTAEDINYLYIGTDEWSNVGDSQAIRPVYNESFEKIRSISVKNSNRFNILQTIAETFECWMRFDIQHDSTGRTIYVDGIPQKFVTVVKDVGEETGVGFIYGIDLKAVSRDIQSDQIVTKTIVPQNSNEYAIDGFCSIARSTENYPRVNYILNFDYYITQGLLDGGELNKDLYLSTGSIGYYYNLNQLNTQYDAFTDEIVNLKNELDSQISYRTVYENTLTAYQDEATRMRAEAMNLSGTDSWNAALNFYKNHSDFLDLGKRINAALTAENNAATYQDLADRISTSISNLENRLYDDTNGLIVQQQNIVDDIKALDLAFYKKYSRFLQEGTWNSEDYIDDNLYFLDAQSVAYTASRPQIAYNISVIRISSLPEFKNKVFKCGDISFVQDPEFFGYTSFTVSQGTFKTPYKEKVLVSEVTSYFDSPEKDTFKVQNYKTQFEDLFQRITATTQSLQYASGGYARAASIVTTEGTITPEVLQNSIALNEQLVYSAKNDVIIQDSTGLTVADATNPNNKTKITSGGLFITTDGGNTWKNAVRGEGIATQYLTTGAINANQINIYDGNFRTFRWDSSGINAYSTSEYGVNLSKFVRFDHFGIYGMEGVDGDGAEYTPTDENQIWNEAKFGMTWRGFFVKNLYGNHYVEVSNEEDIRVVDTTDSAHPIDRVKIGQLQAATDSTDGVYGLRLKDATGTTTLETTSDGRLWLTDSLNVAKSSDSYHIQLGYLSGTKASDSSIHEVFNATDKFIVYEDGSMKATSGEFSGTIYATSGSFTGTIHATSGTIGNVTIGEVQSATYKVNVASDSGTIFKNGTIQTTLRATLYKGADAVTSGTIIYQWYKNGTAISSASDSIYFVNESNVTNPIVYDCHVAYTPPST